MKEARAGGEMRPQRAEVQKDMVNFVEKTEQNSYKYVGSLWGMLS